MTFEYIVVSKFINIWNENNSNNKSKETWGEDIVKSHQKKKKNELSNWTILGPLLWTTPTHKNLKEPQSTPPFKLAPTQQAFEMFPKVTIEKLRKKYIRLSLNYHPIINVPPTNY
jgi:uncharacterized surface protein with fasciclin (FAS1) repeats